MRKALDSSQKKWWRIGPKNASRSPILVSVDMASELGLPPARPLVEQDLDSLSAQHHGSIGLDEESEEFGGAREPSLKYKKLLLTACTTKSPLDQPSLLARILTYLPFSEIVRSQLVCAPWRRLFLRTDLILWKSLVRSARIPPRFRGAFWLMLCYVSYVDPLAPKIAACPCRVSICKHSNAVRWRSLLAPFPPSKGPTRVAPADLLDIGMFSTPHMKVSVPDVSMESILKRYHKCGLAAQSAATMEYARKLYTEDLAQVQAELEPLMPKQEDLMKKRGELEPKSVRKRVRALPPPPSAHDAALSTDCSTSFCCCSVGFRGCAARVRDVAGSLSPVFTRTAFAGIPSE